MIVVGGVIGHLRRDVDGKGATRCGGEGRQFDIALFNADTVLQYLEIEGEVGKIDEGVVVANDQALVVLAVVETEGHVLVYLLDDVEFGSPLAFGSDHTVVDEVTLVRTGIVIAGGQMLDALFEFLGIVDALIHPVPNATADTEFRFLDDVPVLAEITHAVAHGVVVFAHEEGLAGGVVVGMLLHVAHIGVHFREQIRDTGEVAVGVCGTFVVNGARIELARGVINGDEVVACARFVTERPEDDRGMVAVALHHAHNAVDHRGLPRLLSGDDCCVIATVCTVVVPVFMAFEVSFVHNVEAIVVEHGVHFGLTRVVRGANGVDIGLLHEGNVLQHRGHVDGASEFGVRVLGVHALKEDTCAVDEHLSVANLDVAETILRVERHFFLAACVFLHDDHGVEFGRFGRPKAEIIEIVEGNVYLLARFAGSEGNRLLALRHLLAVGVEKRDFHALVGSGFVTVVEFELDVERTALVAFCRIEVGGDVVVAHKGAGSGHQIDITVQTAHVEDVLSFEIRAVRPANHLHTDIVLAGAERGSDVKFGIVVGSLRVADVFAVDPHISAAIDAVEVEEHALAVPVGGKIELAAVASHGIGVYLSAILLAQLDIGRVVFENVVHIHVNRLVISLHFPARGHFNVVPCCGVVVVLDKSGVAFGGIGGVAELPSAVERLHFCGVRIEPGLLEARIGLQCGRIGVRHERGAAGFLVNGEDGFVLPLGLDLSHAVFFPILHFGEAEQLVAVSTIAHIDVALLVHAEQIHAVSSRDEAINVLLSLHRFEEKALVGVVFVEIPLQRFPGAVERQVHCFLVVAVVDHKSAVACVEELEHL